MAEPVDDYSHVTFDGKTIVNTRVLLRDPKVRKTIEKLSKANRPVPHRRAITLLRPVKPAG
jgi:hypothetical protein